MPDDQTREHLNDFLAVFNRGGAACGWDGYRYPNDVPDPIEMIVLLAEAYELLSGQPFAYEDVKAWREKVSEMAERTAKVGRS